MKQFIVVIISFLFVFSVAGHDLQPIRYKNVAKPDAVKFRGLVTDALGKKVSGAVVLIDGGKFRRELKSNKKGEFEYKMPAGTYRIVIQKPGYKKHIWEAFNITGNTKTPHEFKVQFAQVPDVHHINP